MVDKIKLPVVIPDRLLISPGIWNDNEYSATELGDAFAKTDWNDKSKISLWLNHEDRDTSAFVGYIRNPILASEGRVFGDLEIWDEKLAINLTQAMAKFGVSAKIKGEEDKKGKMHNFTFENFSVVTVPACSEAYINLSKKNITSKYFISNKEIDDMGLDDETIAKRNKEALSNTIEKEVENMAEKEEKKEEVVEEKTEEVKEEKELSEKDMLKALNEKFDKLITLLSKKLEEDEKPEEKVEEKPVEEPVEEKVDEPEVPAEEPAAEENKELTSVKKELAEIKEKLNAPESKTIRNLSSNTVGDSAKFNDDTFCDFLGSVDRPMKFM